MGEISGHGGVRESGPCRAARPLGRMHPRQFCGVSTPRPLPSSHVPINTNNACQVTLPLLSPTVLGYALSPDRRISEEVSAAYSRSGTTGDDFHIRGFVSNGHGSRVGTMDLSSTLQENAISTLPWNYRHPVFATTTSVIILLHPIHTYDARHFTSQNT